MINSEQIHKLIADLSEKPINTVYLWNDGDDPFFESIINRLVDTNDPEVLDWLWNALAIKEKEYDVDSSSLNEKGKELVNKLIEQKNNWLNLSVTNNRYDVHKNILRNINSVLDGQRIYLKPCTPEDDIDLYIHHVETDGDFPLYATPTHSTDSPSGLWLNCALPFSFFVYLKETDEQIGLATICDHDMNHNTVLMVGELHYYIYKQHRHHGYAYEAVSLLIDCFFNKKLKNYVPTNKQFVIEERYCEPVCLKIKANSNNIPSNELAKKLGFVFEGTNHYHKFMDEIPQHENSYFLDLASYKR